MGARVKETGMPLLYVHCIGGQDELVFDGASFALDGEGAAHLAGPSRSRRRSMSVDFATARRSRAPMRASRSPRQQASTAR